MLKSLNDFLRLESAGGILLVVAAIAAMLFDNSPLTPIGTFQMPDRGGVHRLYELL